MKNCALLACTVIASCNQAPQSAPQASTTVNTRSLLADGSAQACSQQDVRDTVLSNVRPKISPTDEITGADIEAGLSVVTYTIDTITVAAIDKVISSVSCDANLTVHVRDKEDRTFSIRYTIRPSVEDSSSFVVTAMTSDAAEHARQAALEATYQAGLARDRAVAAEESAANPEPDAEPVAEPTAEPNNATSGVDNSF